MTAFFIVLLYIYVPYLLNFMIPALDQKAIAISLDPDLDLSEKIAFFIVLHFFVVMFLISYFRTFLTDPGKVPSYWHSMVLEELNRFDQEIQINYRMGPNFRDMSKSVDYNTVKPNEDAFLERNALSETSQNNINPHIENEESAIPPALDELKLSELEDRFLKERGFERFCQHCQNFKPPRAHHCRECGHCVLKMDHHCPWVLNCIGYFNYKLFFNMLLFGDISILMITISFWTFLRGKLEDLDTEISELAYFSSVFACMIMLSSLLTLFLMFHTMLVLQGKSTIEKCDKKKKEHDYDQGVFLNLKEVFGGNPLLWFMPVKVHGNDDEGVYFRDRQNV